MSRLPKIHGHRGARGLLPENSLVAIEKAIELGCDGVEVDLCISADHHLIVHHDPILSPNLVRNEQGMWIPPGTYLYQLDIAQIKQLNIGAIRPDSTYQKRFAQQSPLQHAGIPTLDEFVHLANRLNNQLVFNLELKNIPDNDQAFPHIDQHIDIVASKLDELNIGERVFIQSFDWQLALGVKQRCPQVTVGLLTDQQANGHPVSPQKGIRSQWTNHSDLADYAHIPEMISQCGGQIWSSNFLDLNQQDVDSAHQLGLKVCAWTANELTDMQTVLDMGVDIITTDYPDQLLALVQSFNAHHQP